MGKRARLILLLLFLTLGTSARALPPIAISLGHHLALLNGQSGLGAGIGASIRLGSAPMYVGVESGASYWRFATPIGNGEMGLGFLAVPILARLQFGPYTHTGRGFHPFFAVAAGPVLLQGIVQIPGSGIGRGSLLMYQINLEPGMAFVLNEQTWIRLQTTVGVFSDASLLAAEMGLSFTL